MTRTHDMRSGGRPSRERAVEIGEAIVSATIDAFAEHGMNFGIDQMAVAAGISKQAVYRRWPGKTDLLIHALDQEARRLAARVADALPDDPEAALREVAWRMFDNDKSKVNRIGVFLQAEALRDARLQRHLLGWHEMLLRQLSARIRILLVAIDKDAGAAPALAAILHDLLSGACAMLAGTAAPPAGNRTVFDLRWAAFVRIVRFTDDAGAQPIRSIS